MYHIRRCVLTILLRHIDPCIWFFSKLYVVRNGVYCTLTGEKLWCAGARLVQKKLSKYMRHIVDSVRKYTAKIDWQRGKTFDAFLLDMPELMHISPIMKRREFPQLDPQHQERFGWVQLPQSSSSGFAIGVFYGSHSFRQLAFADGHGRVFVSSAYEQGIVDQADFFFSKEQEVRRPQAYRAQTSLKHVVDVIQSRGKVRKAIRGGIVARNSQGVYTWLASWLKVDNRYTLEQLRMPLPERLRTNLEYRDALTIAFFAAYFLPSMQGKLIGFGSGNIFKHLNRQAPISAIRQSVRETMQTQAQGYRVSSLEKYFADLMHQAGAFDPEYRLEAVHGAEPLALVSSSYSGAYTLTWEQQLSLSSVLAVLRIEGNLNRFASVSMWLERNATDSVTPTEDTVTEAQVAQADIAFIENPALLALHTLDMGNIRLDQDQWVEAIEHFMHVAGQHAEKMSYIYPALSDTDQSIDDDQWIDSGVDPSNEKSHSEWAYRQTMASLIRRLYVPYRFDSEFRVNLEDGLVAIAYSAASASMMPQIRNGDAQEAWVTLNDTERACMASKYNLRVGILLAAMAFASDSTIDQVSLTLHAIDIEQAADQQHEALDELMQNIMRAVTRAAQQRQSSSKADPKDGDIHGDSAVNAVHNRDIAGIVPEESQNSQSQEKTNEADLNTENAESDGNNSTESARARNATQQQSDFSFEKQEENEQDYVNNSDVDDATVASWIEQINDESFVYDEHELESDTQSEDEFDPLLDDIDHEENPHNRIPAHAIMTTPQIYTLMTVTFTRDEFMHALRHYGMRDIVEMYRAANAEMQLDDQDILQPIEAHLNLRDERFSPHGAQEEPELSDVILPQYAQQILGTATVAGLAIQREDVLQKAMGELHRIATDTTLTRADKAEQATQYLQSIADPELAVFAPTILTALIDAKPIPDIELHASKDLQSARFQARQFLFRGEVLQAVEHIEQAIEQVEELFNTSDGIPRYFNSYAERVVYNRLFATSDERTVLIPDNLFYAHMECADILVQTQYADRALPHLNALVQYAPSYPLAHMKLALHLAMQEDWASAKAACLNALRVCLDREDAAYAYYRLAYASWMLDEFDIASASYIMCQTFALGQIPACEEEHQELIARARSQDIDIPMTIDQAHETLEYYNLPVWPSGEVSIIVEEAARVCVDEGMFVPARTLSVAAARMSENIMEGMDSVQAQFIRSLGS